MDRSLDEIVADRQRSVPVGPSSRRGGPPPRRGPHNNHSYPRDGVRKVAPPFPSSVLEKYQRANHQSTRDERTNLDNDWVHDRYDDDDEQPVEDRAGPGRSRRRRDDSRDGRHDDRRDYRRDDRRDTRRDDRLPRDERYDDDRDRAPATAKLRVDNLHYDLTEDDIYELFTRIAPVVDVRMRYDRAGRSEGIAFVTYEHIADARQAIREFDGANAKGQPIRIQLVPAPRRDNPFDRVENPRSLLDRVEAPAGRNRRRSESPVGDLDEARGKRGSRRAPRSRDRRSDVTKPAPENIDRYIPGEGGRRSTTQRGGRRPGERRERPGRGGRDANGHPMVGGRPRKTQEELDAEMDDYWGGSANANAGDADANNGSNSNSNNNNQEASQPAKLPPAAAAADDDIDMIE